MLDAHLHADRLDSPGEALSRARAKGVSSFVVPSVGPEKWRPLSELEQTHADLHVAYGIHPWAAALLTDTERPETLGALRDWLREHPHVALGEMGLDHHRSFAAETHAAQEKCFVAQLAMAHLLNKPVVIHCVRAHGRCLDILRDMGVPEAGGMVHSFTGSIEVAERYLKLGLHLSFSGSLTKRHHKKSRAAAAVLPMNRILVETDAPDQTPVGRGNVANEPAFLPDTIAALAELRGMDPLDVARETEQNARALFHLPSPLHDKGHRP